MPTKRRSKRWAEWSARWNWPVRVGAWDGEVDRRKRAAFLAEQIKATERHARAIAAAIAATTAPISIALQTATTPAGLEKLKTLALADAYGLRAALTEARLAAVSLPGLIAAERLVLGMPTEHHQITEAVTRDPIAEAIVSDEQARDAAIFLLDCAAKAGRSGG
jgi:hypothetical protein